MTPEGLFLRVADRPGVVWLDSGDGLGWSIVSWDPVDVVGGRSWLADARRRLRSRSTDPTVPFASGLIGYVGYEAGDTVAPVPPGRDSWEPPVHLARHEGAACYEHATKRWVVTGPAGFRADAERALSGPCRLPEPGLPPSSARRATVARELHAAAVVRVLELIHAGDCYQINLTRPVQVEGAGDPVQAYRRLRASPATHGAFLRIDASTAILSNSPECLLQVRGRILRSDPIKGTRPRAVGADDDANRAALWESDKDRAELTMIVDLVRNDLSRVARPGTVRAGQRELRAHPTVFHTHWPVTAELDAGLDSLDALAAVFPPGSVTGAPKVRSTERIAELEPLPLPDGARLARGVYTGALGYLADGGDAELSVAIRVAVFQGDRARYHVGGGIVAASDPAEEWAETLAKETALAAALTAL